MIVEQDANRMLRGNQHHANGSLDSEVIRCQFGVIDLQHQPGIFQSPPPHLTEISTLMGLERTWRLIAQTFGLVNV